MHDLIRRAARFGIDAYGPLIYIYTGEPQNVAGLRKLVRETVTEFPEIRGYVLLTEGFFYRVWFGAGGSAEVDLKAWLRHWAGGVGIVGGKSRNNNPAIGGSPR